MNPNQNKPRVTRETSSDAVRGKNRFRAHEHLRKRSDFDRVFAARCRAGDNLLVVHVVSNELEWSRLGISVSKRIGGAVVRNSIRRRIREAFRLSKREIPNGYDMVCVAREGAADKRDLAPSLVKLARRAVSRSKQSRQEPGRP